MTKKNSELLKISGVCLEFFFIIHTCIIIFPSYDTQKFQNAGKFPDPVSEVQTLLSVNPLERPNCRARPIPPVTFVAAPSRPSDRQCPSGRGCDMQISKWTNDDILLHPILEKGSTVLLLLLLLLLLLCPPPPEI